MTDNKQTGNTDHMRTTAINKMDNGMYDELEAFGYKDINDWLENAGIKKPERKGHARI